MSSVYDGLDEKFTQNGTYDKLPSNEQTLRNYIHYLEDSGQVIREPEHRWVYDYVFDTPPGEQMLKNFFSARKITCIDDVWRSTPDGWNEKTGGSAMQSAILSEENLTGRNT